MQIYNPILFSNEDEKTLYIEIIDFLDMRVYKKEINLKFFDY